MVSKTRDKLIEVARQLFVNKGVENTTMNDIAAASDKGRRTIYTYFRNKREIYDAVVESESNSIISSLKDIVESDMPPVEKLKRYIERRFEFIRSNTHKPKNSYDRYRMLFSRDARRVEKIYDMARIKEQAIFAQLLQDGIRKGVFDPVQADRLPALMSLVFMAMDHIKLNSLSAKIFDIEHIRGNVTDFVTKGIINPINQHKDK